MSHTTNSDDFWADVDSSPPLTPTELAQAAETEAGLGALAAYGRELRALERADPEAFYNVPLSTREDLCGPQHGSQVTVEFPDTMPDTAGKLWDIREDEVEVDHFWYFATYAVGGPCVVRTQRGATLVAGVPHPGE